jgi:hypothetical protein
VSDTWDKVLMVLRVACYGAVLLAIVSLLMSGVAEPFAWLDSLMAKVFGKGAEFTEAGITFFVIVMLWAGALKLLPGDVMHVFWWNERRNGRL